VEGQAADEPARGFSGLGIRERRSWATWQLASAVLIAVVVGMWVGWSGRGGGRASASAGAQSTHLTLPPLTVAPAATTVTTPATTAPAATATTTTVSSSGTSAAATGPIVVVMPNTNDRGPADLPAITTAGHLQIGWKFSCVAAPGGAATFEILLVAASGGATSPVLTQTGRSGTGVTPLGNTGQVRLRVVTDPGCVWAVKAVGIAG